MFSGLVLLLVLGMGATVLGFSSRSLRHEPYQERFAVIGSLLVGGAALLAVTTDLLVLAAAWVATSLLTVAIIRTGPEAGLEARSLRARRSLLVGDVAVVAAVVAIVAATGSTAVADAAGAGAVVIGLAGVLVVIAAASRSASGPFYRWLPDSLGAPTPSSALLHAGVVSGGAIVLIKLGPAVMPSWPVAVAALLIGGLTCVFAEAVMLTRPDVKGRLAWSTIAQMSFTLLLCGLGLYVVAGLHLVAHGFYKGALFLGSGSGVRGLVRQRSGPPAAVGRPSTRLVGWLVAFAVTGVALVAAVVVTGTTLTNELAVPVGLAWVAGGCATAAGLHRAGRLRQSVLVATSGAVLVALYLVVTVALEGRLNPEIGAASPTLSTLWVLPVLAALVLVASTRGVDPSADTVLGRAWAFARQAGRPTAAPRFNLAGPLAWRPDRPTAPAHQPALVHLTGA